MTERRLGAELIARFGRTAWTTAAAYAGIVVVIFVAASEFQMRRSLEASADLIESQLALYADPRGTMASVAPDTLAKQLVGMGLQFAITRRVDTTGVYFLSPTMPAQRLKGLSTMASPEEVRALLLSALARHARWRFHVFHRAVGEFDIYVVASRVPFLTALGGLALGALALLPVAVLLARRGVTRSVAETLGPLERVARETSAIGPEDLGRRLPTPTGQAEVTALAESINRMLERVDEAHQALRSFSADASHELRTPLAHLRAQAQWAQDEARTPEQMRESLAAIEQELDRTTKMVEDLFLIARGENRQLSLESVSFDLREVIREVHEIAMAMAAGRPLTVSSEAHEPVSVVGDPNRTRQVLLNLVGNAVRYTAEGRVSLLVRREDGWGIVEVRDTGCGIPAASQEAIFRRFYRVDQSRSRSLGGAGLGLTIARVLTELQEGRLTVSSEVGRGSTFSLHLPLSAD